MEDQSFSSHHEVHDRAGHFSWHPALRPDTLSPPQASNYDVHQNDPTNTVKEDYEATEAFDNPTPPDIPRNPSFEMQQPQSSHVEDVSHGLASDIDKSEEVASEKNSRHEDLPLGERKLDHDPTEVVPQGEALEILSERSLERNGVVGIDKSTKDPTSTATPIDSLAISESPTIFHFDGTSHAAPIDPAWGFDSKAIERDVSPQLSRTASFPEVPMPEGHEDVHLKQPLSHSQVEDIMDEIHESTHLHNDARANSMPDNRGDLPVEDPFDAAINRDEDSFFANVSGIGTHDVSSPADEESRFEEGLPLVQHDLDIEEEEEDDILARPSQNQQNVSFEFLGQGDSTNQDFFEQIIANTSNNEISRPQALDRKTTNQVLDSLHYPPHHETHGDSTDYQESPSLDYITSGDIAVPTGTASLLKMGDSLGDGNEAVTERPFELTENQEQDLAAMWQAALGDDDFLEDDSVDPSAFFGEDGEGFLTNTTEAQSDQFLPEPFSSSPPQSVTRSNGLVRGFSQTGMIEQHSISNDKTLQNRHLSQQQQQPAGGAYSPLQQPSYSPSNAFTPDSFASPVGSTRSMQQMTNTASTSMPRPGMPEHTRSFANQSKGGYTSPYDLPVEVTRPKKKANLQPLQSNTRETMNLPQPPPRSSSIQSATVSPPGSAKYSSPSVHAPRSTLPPTAFGPIAPPTNLVAPSLKTKPSTGSFFEELPIASKPRPLNKAGRPITQFSSTIPTSPQFPPQQGQFDRPLQSSQQPSGLPPSSSPNYQLLPPERVLPYASTSSSSPSQATPVLNPRYSPAPPPQPNSQNNRTRYATPPSGPARPPSISQVLPFQPRTSSPLARSASASQQYLPSSQSTDDSMPQNSLVSGIGRPSLKSFHSERPLHSEIRNSQVDSFDPLIPKHLAESTSTDLNPPQHASQYHHPLEQSQIVSPEIRNFDPPRRSQTQSPGSMIPTSDGYALEALRAQRSSSITYTNPLATGNSHLTSQPTMYNQPFGAGQNTPQSINYLMPSDGRENDLLERWKGCPIFSFGFGGTTVTSFPKQIPRFAAGQKKPLIKCSPGEVKIHTSKIIPLEEQVAAFPGPLKSKSKKKDVLEWLKKGISHLKQQYLSNSPNQTLEESRKRHEEKIILWEILHVFVEYDGIIDGKPAAENAIRYILSPELTAGESLGQFSYDANIPLQKISKSNFKFTARVSEDPEALDALRKFLLQGEREKAVWHAVDQRLWGHAMLISSILSRDIWKQVIQEFVRHEVKAYGENTESLAAVYDIFAGNWEESIDELVPPSARAGLQMVSKVAGPAPTKNALDGLDRWRETLSLVLSNRSPDDEKALAVLGQLLSRYGRIEAAHICYIFAKSQASFGGSDDAEVNFVLLGADHFHQPFDYCRDLDSVLLTEVYEFALTILAPTTISSTVPHLQAHKLSHAMILAEYGYRDEAQQYCDAIQNNLKATTKMSPYYHTLLFGALDDLSSRLRQVPRDASRSWITRPSIDKVSGSVWSRFNHFVSGDDSDAASTGSGRAGETETGPFAKASSESPTISRAESPSNLYGSYVNGGTYTPGPSTTNVTNPQYAPARVYTPRSSLEQPRQPGYPIQESQRSIPIDSFKRVNIQRQSSYSPDLYKKPLPDPYQPISTPATAAYPPNASKYSPTPQVGLDEARDSFVQDSSYSSYQPSSHELSNLVSLPYLQNLIQPDDNISSIRQKPLPRTPLESPSNSYEPRSASFPDSPSLMSDQPSYELQESNSLLHEPLPSLEQPQSSYYQPPSTSLDTPSTSYGYEPPSYDSPNYDPENNGDISPIETRPKRSTINDDEEDDDLAARADARKKSEKARKDREADEAFRRAAEADAQKDTKPNITSKGSWLGGWFSGGKSKDLSSPQPRGPIKAQLGEANSFHYDPVLKKWVNKKDNNATTMSLAATPPPPKGPPSRSVSATGKPARLPPGVDGGLRERASMSNLSLSSSPGSSFPSRNPSPNPASSLSPTMVAEASETLSPPVPNNASSSRPSSSGPPSAPSSRPGTSMGTTTSATTSIDDLIGAPAARKGGTVKKGKKGRGYVDVMAKGME